MKTKTIAEQVEDFFEDVEVKELQKEVTNWLSDLEELFGAPDFFKH